MIRDYGMVSPSLDGVLTESSLSYEGLIRPAIFGEIHDRASIHAKGKEEDRKALETYFHDLYGVLMKKLALFVVGNASTPEDDVRLQAMLQELIKVKSLLGA